MDNTRDNKRVNSKNKRTISHKVEERRNTNKEQFLSQLEEMPIVQAAAARTGIHRSTYYRWKEDDPDFIEKAESTMKKGVHFINDMMESILIKKAKEGNLTAVIFWLKNHHDSYVDIKRLDHRHEFNENPLTEERKAMIAKSMMAWSTCLKCGNSLSDDDSERDSDYEIESVAEKEEQEAKKTISEVKPFPPVVEHKPVTVKSRVARKLVYNPKTKKLE